MGQLWVTVVFWILVFLYDSVVNVALPSCDEDRFSSDVLSGRVRQLHKLTSGDDTTLFLHYSTALWSPRVAQSVHLCFFTISWFES